MLIVITLEQKEQWDNIVRSFKNYDVYWLSGYVKAFKIHGDGEPLLFYYESKSTRAINVVMKRDVAWDEHFKGRILKGQYFDFSTPYGYGGWIIDGEETDKVFEEYGKWTAENGIISEFVRFHPILRNHELCEEYYDVIQLGEVIHMDLSSPDIIWNNITSKNRNMIRKAMKNDVKVYNGRFPEIYEEFRGIYNSTMDKDNAEEYYYFGNEFYESLLVDLPQNAQVFWAEKSGKIIAASIMIFANKRMNYHLSGYLRTFGSLAPTNLILYEAALWGCANGYKTFYLGGGVGSSKDSLFKFKRAFYKGDLNHFYIGKRVFNQPIYKELVNMRQKIESNYFPLYRAKEECILDK